MAKVRARRAERPNATLLCRRVVADMVRTLPELSHIRAARILFVAGEARRGSRAPVARAADRPQRRPPDLHREAPLPRPLDHGDPAQAPLLRAGGERRRSDAARARFLRDGGIGAKDGASLVRGGALMKIAV